MSGLRWPPLFSGSCGSTLRRLFEADQAIEPLDLGEPLMAETTLVIIERVDNYFLRAAVRVISRVHRRRWANLVHERYGEQGRRRGSLSEVHTIEVTEGIECGIGGAAMDGKVSGDFHVGILIADIDRSSEVAKEGHVRHYSDKVLGQACCGERDATTLADPLHRNLGGIDIRETAYGFYRAYRVYENAAVVVGLGILDPLGHETRRMRAGSVAVLRCSSTAPHGSLSTGVDDQMRVACAGPRQQGARNIPSAVVADEFDHGRPRTLVVRAQEPGIDAVSCEASEGCVADVYRAVRRLDWFDAQVEVNGARLVESFTPEIVEIGWFGHGWPVVDEFLDSQICPGHSDQLLSCAKLDRA